MQGPIEYEIRILQLPSIYSVLETNVVCKLASEDRLVFPASTQQYEDSPPESRTEFGVGPPYDPSFDSRARTRRVTLTSNTFSLYSRARLLRIVEVRRSHRLSRPKRIRTAYNGTCVLVRILK